MEYSKKTGIISFCRAQVQWKVGRNENVIMSMSKVYCCNRRDRQNSTIFLLGVHLPPHFIAFILLPKEWEKGIVAREKGSYKIILRRKKGIE